MAYPIWHIYTLSPKLLSSVDLSGQIFDLLANMRNVESPRNKIHHSLIPNQEFDSNCRCLLKMCLYEFLSDFSAALLDITYHPTVKLPVIVNQSFIRIILLHVI